MNKPIRRYDKGERRHKHEGKGVVPTFVIVRDNPKRVIGKCPSGMPLEVRQRLLDEAIPGPNGDRDIDYIKYLYVVHEGAIYEARTSDCGTSYHGFPYRGGLPQRVIDDLKKMAETKGCLDSFERWMKEYIIVRGGK